MASPHTGSPPTSPPTGPREGKEPEALSDHEWDNDAVPIKILPHHTSAADHCTACASDLVRPYLNKGSVSNMITFGIMLVGMLMGGASHADCTALSADSSTPPHPLAPWVLAAGLFGFAGGITNWLAVKMLFDRVCALPGSGVIPMRFKEIREVVKNTIMKTFFDGPYLEQYMDRKMGALVGQVDVAGKLRQALESPEVDAIIDKQLTELADKPEGMLLMMGGIQPIMLKPMVKPFVVGMAEDVAPMLTDLIDVKSILSVEKLRDEIDTLMTDKLQELTPDRVKNLMEEVCPAPPFPPPSPPLTPPPIRNRACRATRETERRDSEIHDVEHTTSKTRPKTRTTQNTHDSKHTHEC